MRAPSPEESSTTRTTFIAAFVIAVFLAMLGASISACGASVSYPSAPYECCQVLWNIKRVVFREDRPPPVDVYETKDSDKGTASKMKPRKNLLAKLFRRGGRLKRKSSSNISQYPNAFAFEAQAALPRDKAILLAELTNSMKENVPDFEKRVAAVPWGGPGGSNWSSGDGSMLATYLKIMKWPADLTAKFPFKLCPKGCKSEVAVAHSLEWREKYKPWCMSPAGIKENTKGYAYTRGHSPSLKGDNTGYSLVWLRFPIHRVDDPIQWVRVVINTLDRAVADSLQRTGGKVGRFNTIFDGQGFTLSQLFGMGPIKIMITMLQDHFPDRLGIILLANFAKPAQMMVNLVKPLITKDVREKLYLLPDEPETRKAMLDAVIGEKHIPYFLGGTDKYRFDTNEYYSSKKHQCTDAESIEYVKTMPYHAS